MKSGNREEKQKPDAARIAPEDQGNNSSQLKKEGQSGKYSSSNCTSTVFREIRKNAEGRNKKSHIKGVVCGARDKGGGRENGKDPGRAVTVFHHGKK